jgi:hypothetical protein
LHVVDLGEKEQEKAEYRDADENFIAPAVHWLIIFTIDLIYRLACDLRLMI